MPGDWRCVVVVVVNVKCCYNSVFSCLCVCRLILFTHEIRFHVFFSPVCLFIYLLYIFPKIVWERGRNGQNAKSVEEKSV